MHGASQRRIKRKRSVIPTECVHLISEYLTWHDLSRKSAVRIIINNPSLFQSCTLNSGITDFEFYSMRDNENREMARDVKIGHCKLRRVILNKLRDKARRQCDKSKEREMRFIEVLMNFVEE